MGCWRRLVENRAGRWGGLEGEASREDDLDEVCPCVCWPLVFVPVAGYHTSSERCVEVSLLCQNRIVLVLVRENEGENENDENSVLFKNLKHRQNKKYWRLFCLLFIERGTHMSTRVGPQQPSPCIICTLGAAQQLLLLPLLVPSLVSTVRRLRSVAAQGTTKRILSVINLNHPGIHLYIRTYSREGTDLSKFGMYHIALPTPTFICVVGLHS